ncbi:MAG: right-handed parallel beta-helix repeat-containing protein [Spirochaetes bacterium]|nr:right-handed parallel beta-helix repeat-containing protein [Spirochaetota bacterium]
MRLYILIIILLLFNLSGMYSCSCGDIERYRNYPYYAGDEYPDQINTDETIITGNVFYVDPATGSIGNDGSTGTPWSTFQEVIESGLIETTEPAEHPYYEGVEMIVKNQDAPVKAGDTIILRSGSHGDILLQDYFNTDYINVIADSGATVTRLHVQSGCRWRFKGLSVIPPAGDAELYASLVFFETSNWHGSVYNITLDNSTIQSAADSSSWTIEDWNSLPWNGIAARGNNITIRDNYLLNINFGITMSGNYALIRSNTVENFSGDGMRGLGNDLFFEYNTVKNCYDVNENHDDGFQSWSINDDPPRERVVLRGNTIIAYTDPAQPFRGTLQGIGCFDGFYINWIVENNLVITDHWHGISLYGAINCRIVNNTVVDLNDERPGPPWIAIMPHKDDTPSYNCIVRNNIATNYIITGSATEDHNFEIEKYTDYADLFADPANFDFHLLPDVSMIDAGAAESAPAMDIEGNARPNGSGYDLGAYEYY